MRTTRTEQLTDRLRELETQYETMRARHESLENFTHAKLVNGTAMVANLKQQAAIERELGI
jgi:flagellar capping protein FliD